MVFIFWFCLFSYYIILRSSDFSVTGIKNAYCSVVDYIFSLTFCVGNSEVYWICICVLFGHQSVTFFSEMFMSVLSSVILSFCILLFVQFLYQLCVYSLILCTSGFFVFLNSSNVLQVYLNLRVYLFVFLFVVEVLFSFWVERNFFSLPVFGEKLFSRWCTLKCGNG